MRLTIIVSVRIRRKDSTFLVKAWGQSMIDAGIDEKDILIVDRSLVREDGRIAVCTIEGRRVVKKI